MLLYQGVLTRIAQGLIVDLIMRTLYRIFTNTWDLFR